MEQISLNIGTIGQKLETARQSKGVSVSEAGQATKILSKFIEAMEKDDFGVLSAPVYAKSFIRMYARYLGLDAQPLIDEYVEKHVPKVKRQLTDDVRQKLAQADPLPEESPAADPRGNNPVFSGVNQAIAQLAGARISSKMVAMVGGTICVVLLILLGVTQCDSNEEETTAPAAGGAALVDRQLLYNTSPNVYLETSGGIVIDQK